MESAFSSLSFMIFSLWISIHGIVVESNRGNVRSESPSFTCLSSSSTSPPSTPPLHGPALPPNSCPQGKTKPPHPPPTNEHKKHKQNRSPPPLPQPPAPPPQSPPPQLLNDQETKRQSHSHSHRMNAGKTVGLFFLGMAAFMQIIMVGFLVFKRRQLLKTMDIYETGS